MLKHFLFLISALALLLTACNSDGNQQSEAEKDDMAEFSGDKEFEAAHDTPTEVTEGLKGNMVEFDTPDGNKSTAYMLRPETASNKYLFVFHEWWGLNDNIKQEADRLFAEMGDVNIMALDLYDGKVTKDQETAGKYVEAVRPDRAEFIIRGAMFFAGPDAKIGTIGWCFGGGWSLKSAVIAEDKAVACVMYYGKPIEKAEELAPLKAPIMGIFATQDKWITPNMANNFMDLAFRNGKKITIHKFDADHAFANPSQPSYNEKEAQRANSLVLKFLKEKMI